MNGDLPAAVRGPRPDTHLDEAGGLEALVAQGVGSLGYEVHDVVLVAAQLPHDAVAWDQVRDGGRAGGVWGRGGLLAGCHGCRSVGVKAYDVIRGPPGGYGAWQTYEVPGGPGCKARGHADVNDDRHQEIKHEMCVWLGKVRGSQTLPKSVLSVGSPCAQGRPLKALGLLQRYTAMDFSLSGLA